MLPAFMPFLFLKIERKYYNLIIVNNFDMTWLYFKLMLIAMWCLIDPNGDKTIRSKYTTHFNSIMIFKENWKVYCFPHPFKSSFKMDMVLMHLLALTSEFNQKIKTHAHLRQGGRMTGTKRKTQDIFDLYDLSILRAHWISASNI